MGYGVIEVGGGKDRCLTYGSIKTPANKPLGERLLSLYRQLTEVIERYEIGSAGIERLFFSVNAKTAMDVAEARGVIRLCLEQNGIRYLELGPGEIKSAVSGNGRASKMEMQKMVKMLLGLKETPQPDDAADALAVALAAAHMRVDR